MQGRCFESREIIFYSEIIFRFQQFDVSSALFITYFRYWWEIIPNILPYTPDSDSPSLAGAYGNCGNGESAGEIERKNSWKGIRFFCVVRFWVCGNMKSFCENVHKSSPLFSPEWWFIHRFLCFPLASLTSVHLVVPSLPLSGFPHYNIITRMAFWKFIRCEYTEMSGMARKESSG